MGGKKETFLCRPVGSDHMLIFLFLKNKNKNKTSFKIGGKKVSTLHGGFIYLDAVPDHTHL